MNRGDTSGTEKSKAIRWKNLSADVTDFQQMKENKGKR